MAITDDDLALVQRCYDEFNARFEDLRTEDGLLAFHAEFFTTDLVIDNVESFPVPTTYEGLEGYRRWFEETLAAYTDIQWELETLRPVGERVFITAFIRGREPGDPTLIEVKLALNHAVREGRIARIEVYLNAATAESAARST